MGVTGGPLGRDGSGSAVLGSAPGRRRGAVVAGALLGVTLLGGCADTTAQDLCTQYDDLVAAADELIAVDLTQERAAVRQAADELRAEIDQFQAVSEGRFDEALSRLRSSLDAARQAAADRGEEARETLQPLLQDALVTVAEAWAVVESAAAAQCPPSDAAG